MTLLCLFSARNTMFCSVLSLGYNFYVDWGNLVKYYSPENSLFLYPKEDKDLNILYTNQNTQPGHRHFPVGKLWPPSTEHSAGHRHSPIGGLNNLRPPVTDHISVDWHSPQGWWTISDLWSSPLVLYTCTGSSSGPKSLTLISLHTVRFRRKKKGRTSHCASH